MSKPLAVVVASAAAREASLPLTVLDAAFREQTGRSVDEHLSMDRVIGAHGELVRSDCTGTAVAARAGFASGNRLFRRHARLHPDWAAMRGREH